MQKFIIFDAGDLRGAAAGLYLKIMNFDGFCIKNHEFALKRMDFVLKIMDFALKMLNLVFKLS